MTAESSLLQLAGDLQLRHCAGPADAAVERVVIDSRDAGQGSLFVAVRGRHANGHAFVAEALSNGASAVLVQEGESVRWPEGVTAACYAVGNTRSALGRVARALAGRPDQRLTLVGVTGTNGKTTVTHLVGDLLEGAGQRCGLLGTIAYKTGLRDVEAGLTTPDAPHLFSLLGEMCEAGLSACAFEASSHALDQGRLDGAEVDVAAFTNVTRDHLDYHTDLDAYLAAKRRLLDHLRGEDRGKPEGRAVINRDDPLLGRAPWPPRTVTVGRSERATIRLVSARCERRGTTVVLDMEGEDVEITTALLGPYNAENLLMTAGIGKALELDPAALVAGLQRARPVQGRMEPVELEGGPLALVDYAHTPDGLEKTLAACRALGGRRLLVVFGCGGDRDRGKRPMMAAAAARGADLAVLTLDNPRTEDPRRILADTQTGFAAEAAEDRSRTVADREEAIAVALSEATPEDVVLVAGKGHETYQIVGSEKLPWDDRAVLRRVWATLRGGAGA